MNNSINMNNRLDKLYDSNEPGIRNLVDKCDTYLNIYSKLKNDIIIINSSLITWYNTWVNDPSLNEFSAYGDPSLNLMLYYNKNMFVALQNILTNQYNFIKSINGFRLPNGECVTFTPNTSIGGINTATNQIRHIRARFNLGTVSNIGIDSSSNQIVDFKSLLNLTTTSTTLDLSSNRYFAKYYYQIGLFPLESYEVDIWFSGTQSGTISQLFKSVIGFIGENSDIGYGTSIIEKNNRLIEQLVFSINMVNDLKKMLTYFA